MLEHKTITRGGQVSIPARVRRRWGTREVIVEDRGGELRIRPMTSDPVSAAYGALAGYPGPSTDELRRNARREERAAERRRRGG